MNAAAKPLSGAIDYKALAPEWGPLLVGLAALYLPMFYSLLFGGIWSTEEQAHGPIIFGLSVWLIMRGWPTVLAERGTSTGAMIFGWFLFFLALLLYILGRTQQVASFEISSLILMLAALLLVKFGAGALRILWFPFFFMLFMVPLPGTVVSMLTLPMKTAVSFVTEHLLYFLGYPIARTGVILQIGQYQLLVADACAGLQTLLTLESLGLFYLNVVRHTSAFRNISLALLIIPISFTANVIRVCALTLITYYFGDAAGQGFLHGFAGMVLFVSALILILGIDSLLRLLARETPAQKRNMAEGA